MKTASGSTGSLKKFDGLRQALNVTYNAMTDIETYELSEVDSEDISDVLLKVEKSFGLKFGERGDNITLAVTFLC